MVYILMPHLLVLFLLTASLSPFIVEHVNMFLPNVRVVSEIQDPFKTRALA